MSTQTSNNIIVRKPLLTYFVLTFAFMWLFFFMLFGLFRLEMNSLPEWFSVISTIIAAWTPSLAAALVTGACEGWGGVRRLFAMFFHFRLPPRWYLAALIPAALALVAGGIYRLFGGAASTAANLSLGTWVFLSVNCLLGAATGEEPGWRGFALPRLLQKYSPLKASLVLSVIWSAWHLPIMLGRGLAGLDLLIYILVFLVYNFSLTALMTWIFQWTSHSLVPMVIAHFSANITPIVVVSGFGLGQEMPVFYITAGLSFVTILMIWAAGGFSRKATYGRLNRGQASAL